MGASRIWRRVRRAWATLGTIAFVVFVGWSLVAYRASSDASRALDGDARVAVTRGEGVQRYRPVGSRASRTGLLFFPGALVDPVAYAPLARAAADAGFPATIVELPRRGAFGGADDPALLASIRALMAAPDGPARWVVAGHSRGAVLAVRIAAERAPRLAGLVLVGTSHPRDVSLAALPVPVSKIVGTRDGLASPEEVRANARLLPASTQWIWVEGGNHSQFGWYGFQPGDRRPTITAAAQRDTTIRAVIAALHAADAATDAADAPGSAAAPVAATRDDAPDGH